MAFDWKKLERDEARQIQDNLRWLGPIWLGLGLTGVIVSWWWGRGSASAWMHVVLGIVTTALWLYHERKQRREEDEDHDKSASGDL